MVDEGKKKQVRSFTLDFYTANIYISFRLCVSVCINMHVNLWINLSHINFSLECEFFSFT